MSARGHLQTLAAGQAVSAPPLEADIVSQDGDVGYGPLADLVGLPGLSRYIRVMCSRRWRSTRQKAI